MFDPAKKNEAVARAQVDYIFVVDSTGSMNTRVANGTGNRWTELQTKLIETIEKLRVGEGHRINLLSFGSRVYREDSLKWSTPPLGITELDGRSTNALSFELRNEDDRNVLLALLRKHRPGASSTALRDAIGGAFERALQLHGLDSNRFVSITVFSDCEDNNSARFRNDRELSSFVVQSKKVMGSSLVGGGYVFVRVAGVSVNAPTEARTVDHTPILASVELRPAKVEPVRPPDLLEPGTLADPDPKHDLTGPVDIFFSSQGLTNNEVFPLVFRPTGSGPSVVVVCEAGSPAAVGVPGKYRIRFRRIGDPALYVQPFEGYLELDLGLYAYQPVDNIHLNKVGAPIRVRFAGNPLEIQAEPTDGRKILMGSKLTFEATAVAGASYKWRFSGASDGTETGSTVVRTFPTAGTIRWELAVEKPGSIPFTTGKRSLEVADPALRVKYSPENPVEGERVAVSVEGSPAVKLGAVIWNTNPAEQDGSHAIYRFAEEGNYNIGAQVKVTLGGSEEVDVSTSATVAVGPGVPLPQLITPEPRRHGDAFEVVLYNQEDPQVLAAEVGGAVSSARFSIMQGNATVASYTAPVSVVAGHHVAQIPISLTSGVKPGRGTLQVESMPRDSSLVARLGPRRSVYDLEIAAWSFSIDGSEPSGSTLLWERETLFVAVMGGAGLKKITGVEWRVELVDGAQTSTLLFATVPASAFEPEGDTSRVSFPLRLAADDPKFAALRRGAALRVRAIPHGDPKVIGGQDAEWDGLRPELPKADFVIVAPYQSELDRKVHLAVVDRLNNNRPAAVRWEVVGEGAQPLANLEAAEQEFAPKEIGPHEIKASVTWAGGEAVSSPHPLLVTFEPAQAGLTWDGGRKPVLSRRGANDDVTKIAFNPPLRGSRARLSIDVRRIDANDRVGASIPGWPKEMSAHDARTGMAVPWPTAKGHESAAYLVEARLTGYTPAGVMDTRPLDSFRLESRPERRWWLLCTMTIVAATLGWFIRWLCWNNEARGFCLVMVSDPERLQPALVGMNSSDRSQPASHAWRVLQQEIAGSGADIALGRRCEIAGKWNLWSKAAFFELGELLHRDLPDEPRWLQATQSIRQLRVRIANNRGRVFLEQRIYSPVDVPGDSALQWKLEGVGLGSKPYALQELVKLAPREEPAAAVALALWNDHGAKDAFAARLKWFGAISLLLLALAWVWVLQNF